MIDHLANLTAGQWGVVIVASLAAAAIDLWKRRIPNALTLPLVVTGLLYGLVYEGFAGLGDAVVGCVLIALPYVLLFIFAGGGAGDAKMMGAIGAWLGLRGGLVALVAVSLTGGVLGLLNLAAKRQLFRGLARIGSAFYVMIVALCSGRKGWELIKPDPDAENTEAADERLKMPYGPAIFIGVCIAALWVHIWNV